MTKAAEKRFLIADINAEWRRGRERALSGAWDSRRAPRGARRRRHRGRDPVPGRHHRDELAAVRRRLLDADRERGARAAVGGLRAPTTAGSRSSSRWRPSGAWASRACRSLWDVEEAVREMRWAREHGLSGRSCPVHVGQARALPPPALRPDSGPACQDLDVVDPLPLGPGAVGGLLRPAAAAGPRPSCPARWASTSPRSCGGTCGRSPS